MLRRASKGTPALAARAAERRSARDWPSAYGWWLVVSDAAVLAAVFVLFRFVLLPSEQRSVTWPNGPGISYTVAILIVALLWMLALSVFETRNRHVVGSGSLEYARIANASAVLFALLVAVAFFLRIEVSRALLLVVIPVGAVLLIFSRWMWRQWLRRQQKARKYVYRAIVLGEHRKAAHIVSAIRRTPGSGFDIVGVVTGGHTGAVLGGVPVLGGYATAIEVMDAVDADTVIVAGADEIDPVVLRRLGWTIADRDANLVVAPQLTDVAGPRIHSRPAAGLPLVYVEYPTLEGYRGFAKRAFDIAASALLIVLTSPLMLVTAAAVVLESGRPVIYRQTRIGRGGTSFLMLKFRSMQVGTDDLLPSLLDREGAAGRPLHKVLNDPRVTRVGRFIRKHSIDELPQLFNVLAGSMSLVGPRPQRESEVALYDDTAERRLLVKPGMSGLWQVSGRSQLSWEDALRLDLYYVENWSFTQDIVILFRTVRAVLFPGSTAI
ncbi:sugar transferase [Microbacterium sp. NPDC076895]|uniref:sugar transferase n=1 Tax=Microbacterium sp. NPDC076895 TaxID=3154957 RepID=UPI003411FC6D